MNIKIENLAVSDFPGIDDAKFNEWKALQTKADRESRITSYIAVGIWLVSSFLIPDFFDWIWFVMFAILFITDVGFYLVRNKRLRQLGKELKISDRLRAKKKGRASAE